MIGTHPWRSGEGASFHNTGQRFIFQQILPALLKHILSFGKCASDTKKKIIFVECWVRREELLFEKNKWTWNLNFSSLCMYPDTWAQVHSLCTDVPGTQLGDAVAGGQAGTAVTPRGRHLEHWNSAGSLLYTWPRRDRLSFLLHQRKRILANRPVIVHHTDFRLCKPGTWC